MPRTSGFRLLGVVFGQFDVEDLALPHPANPGKAEASQGAFNGLALRIEHAGLEGNGNTRDA